MTTAEKKERLRNFKKLGMEIDRKLEEVERLRAWVTRTTPVFSAAPKSHGEGGGFAEKAERLIEVNAQINREIDRYIDERKTIAAAIEGLQDLTQRTIMGMYYLNGQTWEEIAEKIGYDVRHVYRLHGTALEKIEICHVMSL